MFPSGCIMIKTLALIGLNTWPVTTTWVYTRKECFHQILSDQNIGSDRVKYLASKNYLLVKNVSIRLYSYQNIGLALIGLNTWPQTTTWVCRGCFHLVVFWSERWVGSQIENPLPRIHPLMKLSCFQKNWREDIFFKIILFCERYIHIICFYQKKTDLFWLILYVCLIKQLWMDALLCGCHS